MKKVVLTSESDAIPILRQELMRRTQYFWKTKDGTEIPVQEMSDQHLINTINMLERNQHLSELAAEYSSYLWDLD
jgi:hypothetical protein